jgi:hypothetical protein
MAVDRTITAEEHSALREVVGALSYLLTDLEETDMDRNPETGEVYESHAEARNALSALEKLASYWLP